MGTDDKGPVLCWLWAIESFLEKNKNSGLASLPVNIKMVFEGMEESGSVGLADLVRSLAVPSEFLDPDTIDYTCISDSYWLGKNKPCISYGLRGLCYFHLEVQCSKRDLHSGVIGGSVHEAMIDIGHLMASLVDSSGKILVPGIMDDVAPVTSEERKSYETLDFDPEPFKEEVGVDEPLNKTLLYKNKMDILMHRWRYPTLSLHGIEGAFSATGCKTVIPGKSILKFSLRLVPNMEPKKVEKLVRQHVDEAFKKLKSPNKMKLTMVKGSLPWVGKVDNPNFMAGRKAMQTVYNIDPDLIREGGSIPITLVFEQAVGKSVLLLPIGACDDGAHSQNEKIDRRNYINGIKVMIAYMSHLAAS